jgi:hypothetical protein
MQIHSSFHVNIAVKIDDLLAENERDRLQNESESELLPDMKPTTLSGPANTHHDSPPAFA